MIASTLTTAQGRAGATLFIALAVLLGVLAQQQSLAAPVGLGAKTEITEAQPLRTAGLVLAHHKRHGHKKHYFKRGHKKGFFKHGHKKRGFRHGHGFKKFGHGHGFRKFRHGRGHSFKSYGHGRRFKRFGRGKHSAWKH